MASVGSDWSVMICSFVTNGGGWIEGRRLNCASDVLNVSPVVTSSTCSLVKDSSIGGSSANTKACASL